jgi:methyl-accepting chemotaxis protein
MFDRFDLVTRLRALAVLILVLVAGAIGVALDALWAVNTVAQAEIEGLEPAAALLKLLDRSAEHRGMSAGFLGGNPDFVARREAKQQEVDAALVAVEAALDRYPQATIVAARQAVRESWRTLAPAVAQRQLAGPQSFAQHNRLVQEQLRLLDEVVSVSTLALDPQAESYYLIMATLQTMPEAAELTGQLRGFGAGMLSKPEFNPADRTFISRTLDQLNQRAGRVETLLDRASAADAAIGEAMAPVRARSLAALDEARRVIQAQLLDAAAPAMPGAAYFDQITRSIEAQHALADTSFTLLNDILQARQASAWRTAATTAGLGLLALCATAAVLLSMVGAVRKKSVAAMAAARAMAEGDFSVQPGVGGNDEFALILRSLDSARGSMSEALTEVRRGVETISTASAEIAQGSADLSRRAELQASSLQETAASMEEIAGTVRLSAESARQASELAGSARSAATAGGEVMGEMTRTMQSIADSSQRIGTITGVIDGLAFQTNILALNAAVEAARAGEHGRGFAVVAAEVRQLAHRSAEAAREIKQMIAASTERVGTGGSLATAAGERIEGIVTQVQHMAVLVGEIASATREQTQGIGQVNVAVSQMDQGTQQNSALAEQSAAAAESLRVQAQRLADAVARFRLEAA